MNFDKGKKYTEIEKNESAKDLAIQNSTRRMSFILRFTGYLKEAFNGFWIYIQFKSNQAF